MANANITDRAKGPVGHGSTLLLHIAHGIELICRSVHQVNENQCCYLMKEQTVWLSVTQFFKIRKENMS